MSDQTHSASATATAVASDIQPPSLAWKTIPGQPFVLDFDNAAPTWLPTSNPTAHDQTGLGEFSCEFSFLDHLSEGKLVAESPGTATASSVLQDGQPVPTLLLHPPARLAFTVENGSAGQLRFAVGMHPDVWSQKESGACRFIALVDGVVRCDLAIDPVHNPADRRWFGFDVPVNPNPAGKHHFVFITEAVGTRRVSVGALADAILFLAE